MKKMLVCIASITALLVVGCSEDLGFSLIQSPQVDSIEPVEGPTKGGDQVVVTGERFKANTVILFDDKPCRDIDIISETEIHCVTPVHDAGEAVVSATHETTGPGERTATFTFNPPPEFSLHPGDEIGYTKFNVNYCESDTCVGSSNEEEAAWRSSWVIQEDGVYLSETTGQWELNADYFFQVTKGTTNPAPLASTWLSQFGPYDQAADYTEEGVGHYTTSVPPVPTLSGSAVSFPFFDMANFEEAELLFRDAVRAIDPDAAFESQQASRRLEAYYVDQGTPQLAHHVLIIFHSVGIVCHMNEEVAEANSNPSRTQADFSGVIIRPKADLSFAYVKRVGGRKQYCNCSSDTGCE